MGIRAQLEPRGLDGSSHLRPDLLLTLPGRQILSDVAVIHPLTAGAVVRGYEKKKSCVLMQQPSDSLATLVRSDR